MVRSPTLRMLSLNSAKATTIRAANGMMTVVRGVLPSEIFGRADYGTIQGMIAAPTTLARAAGPLLFGLVWSWSGGYGAVVALGLALAVAALISFATTVYAARPGEAGG